MNNECLDCGRTTITLQWVKICSLSEVNRPTLLQERRASSRFNLMWVSPSTPQPTPPPPFVLYSSLVILTNIYHRDWAKFPPSPGWVLRVYEKPCSLPGCLERRQSFKSGNPWNTCWSSVASMGQAQTLGRSQKVKMAFELSPAGGEGVSQTEGGVYLSLRSGCNQQGMSDKLHHLSETVSSSVK